MRSNGIVASVLTIGILGGICWGQGSPQATVPATNGGAAVVLYVNNSHPQADDQNAGTAALPFKTIQAAVDKAGATDTVMVMPGLYRETVSVKKSGLAKDQMFQIVSAQPRGAIIRGSEVVTDWQPVGPGLFRMPWAHKMPHNQERQFGVKSISEGVWVDGQPLAPVALREQMTQGTFFVDRDGKQLYIQLAANDSPAGHLVEVAMRQNWMAVNANFVRVDGFRMEQCVASVQQAGMRVVGSDCVIENCEFSQAAAGIGLKVSGARALVRRCESHHNGQMGVGGNGFDHVWEDNFIHHNNTRPIMGWESGVGKFANCVNGVWRRNVFADTPVGPGLWFDIDNYHNIIEQNLFSNLGDNAIMIEISYHNIVRNNVIVNTNPDGVRGYSRTGILVQLSSETKIYNNLVYGTQGYGIHIRWHVRPRKDHLFPNITLEQFREKFGFDRDAWMGPHEQYPVKENDIYNNLLVNNTHGAIRIDFQKDFVYDNRSDHNLFVDYASDHPMDGGHRLMEWQGMTGLDQNSLYVRVKNKTPLFVNPGAMDFRLVEGSVAIDAGRPIEDLTVDFTGQPRSGTPDIGPYEYVAPPASQPDTAPAR